LTRLIPLGLLGLLLVGPAAAQPRLGPSIGQTSIPASPKPATVERARQAVNDYATDYGPVLVSVVVGTTAGDPDDPQFDLAQALKTEVESQLTRYAGRALQIKDHELDTAKTRRMLELQGGDAPEAFMQEAVRAASTPYVLVLQLGEDTSGVKDAGVATLRLLETATGRALVSVSDQFYQDKKRYPNVADQAWVQHSVTYWMEELFAPSGVPEALGGPFLVTLQLQGEVPAALNGQLKQRLAEATGMAETAINPRRLSGDFDTVFIDLLLPEPPHTVMDNLVAQLIDAFAAADLRAQPLRQNAGDLAFAVSSTPAWWALTDRDAAGPQFDAWKGLLELAGQPPVAVLSYTDPAVSKAMEKRRDAAVFAGRGRALAQAIESQLIGAGLEVVGVEPVDAPYANGASAVPEHLRQRARWVCYVEIVPGLPGEDGRALARLLDLQTDRVLGAAAYPGSGSRLPADARVDSPLDHASRYLTGELMADAITNPQAFRRMQVAVTPCPSFEFGNRVGNIVLAQADVADVILPTFTDESTYRFEVRYHGSPQQFSDRLRADLSSLPLKVDEYGEGRLELIYEQ
jgi:hypothetical protein